jgi:hypothetical protein
MSNSREKDGIPTRPKLKIKMGPKETTALEEVVIWRGGELSI